jgi:hypothetical protein
MVAKDQGKESNTESFREERGEHYELERIA